MGKEKERGREGRDGWMQGREGRKWGERWGRKRGRDGGGEGGREGGRKKLT